MQPEINTSNLGLEENDDDVASYLNFIAAESGLGALPDSIISAVCKLLGDARKAGYEERSTNE